MWGLVLASSLTAAATYVEPVAAVHGGTVVDGVVEWEAVILLDRDVRQPEIPLAVPLSEEVELVGSVPPGAVLDATRTMVWVPSTTSQVVLRLHETRSDASGEPLGVPLVAGRALQRVQLTGARFEPDDSLGLENRVRYDGPPGLTGRERRAVNRVWRRTKRRATRPLYVRDGAGLRAAGGLAGDLVLREEEDRRTAVGFGLLFACLCVLALALAAGGPTAAEP